MRLSVGIDVFRRISELASGPTGTRVPRKGLRVRIPCPPLDPLLAALKSLPGFNAVFSCALLCPSRGSSPLKTLVFILALLSVASPLPAEALPGLFEDDFENGLGLWETTDTGLETSVWKLHEEPDSENRVLRVTGPSRYQPPFRSPHSIAWVKAIHVADFQMDVRLQNTRTEAGPHRDLCLFWGRQDAGHFYYVHLGAAADRHACQIFIVNGAARKAITKKSAMGTNWTAGWHHVRVTHDASTHDVHVYFDDMERPYMTANDATFTCGQVGLGTFDDHGNFDDFVLRGTTCPAPPAVD